LKDVMDSRLEILKSNPYFEGLSSSELEAINKYVFEKKYQRDEILLLEGEAAGVLYFVVAGAVKVFKTSADGKEQILAIVSPPETFNEIPVLNGGINPASAQAMTPLTVYGISSADMWKILRDYCQVAINTIQVLAKRLRHMILLVEDLSFRRVIGRVAKILLDYAGDGVTAGTRLTQRDMAAIAGTAREVVSRSLKSLEDDDIINIDKHCVVIKNRQALEEMAMTIV
jgi:CRP/FNR family transcriptional regulator